MPLKKNSALIFYTKNIIDFFTQITKTQWLFVIILAVGIFARTWEFRIMPPGLNSDEASIGIEAYDLYKFGIDRNGISYPVHLISWGTGQNVLYAYMLIPLIALKDQLTPVIIRLPIVLAGIFSLPLMYYAGKRLLGTKSALIAMFLMAISPYHIVNSRWAVESNILPFVFLAGFAFLLATKRNGLWFIPALVCFALCLYAYGTAYVAVPIFLALCIPAVMYLKRVETKYLISGLMLFGLLALPIFLFVIINSFKLETIHIGNLTIPRLPAEPRYESLAAVSGKAPLIAMADNIRIMFDLLWKQEDAFSWNFVDPFGYFYTFTFPLIAIGFYFLVISFKSSSENTFERWLLLSWIISSLCIGIIHPVNLTRLNLIFTPLLFCIVICLDELGKRIKSVSAIALVVLSIGFIFFTLAYHGITYERQADEVFNAGIIPAIEFADQNTKSVVCITEQTSFAYIYVLFVKKYNPVDYVDRIEWLLPSDYPLNPARTPRALGQFRFRNSDCVQDPKAAYILKLKETPSNQQIAYKTKRFTKYEVYLPKVNP